MIEWKEIQPDQLIHGIVNGKVIIRIEREGPPKFLWEMSGLLSDCSQYRNDLKERAEVYLKIYDILVDIIVRTQGLTKDDISMDYTLKDDIGMDSLDVVEFSMEIEREWRMRFEDEVLENFQDKTISEVITLILNR